MGMRFATHSKGKIVPDRELAGESAIAGGVYDRAFAPQQCWAVRIRVFVYRLPKFSGSALGSPNVSEMSTVDWPVSSKRFRHL